MDFGGKIKLGPFSTLDVSTTWIQQSSSALLQSSAKLFFACSADDDSSVHVVQMSSFKNYRGFTFPLFFFFIFIFLLLQKVIIKWVSTQKQHYTIFKV